MHAVVRSRIVASSPRILLTKARLFAVAAAFVAVAAWARQLDVERVRRVLGTLCDGLEFMSPTGGQVENF